MRLDKFLSSHLTGLSRSRIQALLAQGHIGKADGATITGASYHVKPGETWHVTIPAATPSYLTPVPMDLVIVYEDDHILVIDKPAGLTVHPGAGTSYHTLVNALLSHCGTSLSGIGGVQRPGIVHRLDKDTSGLLVVAKHDQAHQSLTKQLQERTLKRTYIALCWGRPMPPKGTFSGRIGRHPHHRQKMAVLTSPRGKEAFTHYKITTVFGGGIASQVECQLETGRTHQIRVHFAHHTYPLIGDKTYGRAPSHKIKNIPQEIQDVIKNFPRQALHAAALEMEHPFSHQKVAFTSPLPLDICVLIDALKQLQ